MCSSVWCVVCFFFFFQAEDGIRDLVRSRGLGDMYKRQVPVVALTEPPGTGLTGIADIVLGVTEVDFGAFRSLSLIHI